MSKSFLITVIVFSILLVGGSYLLLAGDEQKKITDLPKVYSSNDKSKPQAEVKKDFKDLGEMKVSEQKSVEFTLKNVGQEVLTLSDISSSCGCTVGQIIIDGKTSEEFGMHSQSTYRADLKPGKEVKVKVTYRPYIMPVSGEVDREVYVTTNDPDNPKLVFKVKAFIK